MTDLNYTDLLLATLDDAAMAAYADSNSEGN